MKSIKYKQSLRSKDLDVLSIKGLIAASLATGVFFLSTGSVLAHAVVKPAQAGIGSYTDFSLGVPSEKDAATVAVELMIPAGLASISPIVKPGWKVEVKDGPVPSGVQLAPDDDGNIPTTVPAEIDWTGGSIPSEQKDFFMFTAQVPSKETELDWKVIQTYSDGSTVSWTMGANEQPKDDKGQPDFSKFGPYSKTMVVNDLKASPQDNSMMAVSNTSAGVKSSTESKLPLVLSGLAVVLSAVALSFSLKKS